METYWVTFRIEHDLTYPDRYAKFTESVTKADAGRWSEPSSFYLVESDLAIDDFAKSITKSLNPKTDIVLVRYLSKDGAVAFGAVEQMDVLRSFMPKVKKL